MEYAIEGRCWVTEARLLSLAESKLGEIDRQIDDLIKFRNDLRQYHNNLSRRLGSEAQEEHTRSDQVSCQCIGEEVDGFGR